MIQRPESPPITLPGLSGFLSEFPDDEACLRLLWRRRFAPDGETAGCPRCLTARVFRRYGTADRRRSWTCTGCGHHLHPTMGTILEKSSTGLRVWFHAAYLLAATGGEVPPGPLARELGVPYNTARRIRQTLRAALAALPPAPGGPDPLSVFFPATDVPLAPAQAPAPATAPAPGPAPDLGTAPAAGGGGVPGRDAGTAPGRDRGRGGRPAGKGGGLPADRTRFIGRQAECRTLRGLLRRSRLVTLVGAGGSGKTRLAARVGAAVLPLHPGGVWWVDLTPVSANQSVLDTVAGTLGLREERGSPLEVVVGEYLSGRTALLVLDNCEHLLDGCAEVIDLILRDCPDVRLLVTSREPIGVPGETVWRVPSLPVPDPAGLDGVPDPAELRALAANDAVRLFTDRARLALPSFRLAAGNARAVARVCRRLDGIPLAIELAAARMAALSPRQIAGMLDDCFAVLRGGGRGALPRHQALRASMDWSHRLLAEDERILFRRLGVFTGGFDLPAVRAVCADTADGELIDRITNLAAKSLVVVEPQDGVHRYRLLETVRQYAVDRLAESGEADLVRDRHLGWALDLAERAAPAMETVDQHAWLAVLAVEYPNLRAALDWAVARHPGDTPLRLATALSFFHIIRGVGEGSRCFEQALAAAGPGPSIRLGRALWGAAYVTFILGDYQQAHRYATAALATAREHDDLTTIARTLAVVGNIDVSTRPREARARLAESAELAARVGDDWCLAYASCLTAMTWTVRADPAAARRSLAVAYERAVPLGDGYMLAWLSLITALTARRDGDLGEARAAATRAAAYADRVSDPACRAWAAGCIADLDSRRGRAGVARAAAAQETGPGRPALPMVAKHLHAAKGRTALARGDLDVAERELRLAVGLCRDLTDIFQESESLVHLAEVLLLQGRVTEVRAVAADVLGHAAALDNPWLASAADVILARLARAEGDLDEALRLCHRALAVQQQHGYRPDAVQALELIAGIRAERGTPIVAARLLAAADAARGRLGLGPRPVEIPGRRADRARLWVNPDRAALREARRRGAALTLDEAIAYATRGRGTRAPGGAGWAGLTPTELTVAELIASGLTNAEIADRMLISRATVKAHLSRVFGKLGVSHRAGVAAEAARRANGGSAGSH